MMIAILSLPTKVMQLSGGQFLAFVWSVLTVNQKGLKQMRNKFLSLLFGIMFSVLQVGAQETIEIPVVKDSMKQTLTVKFETNPIRTNVSFKNTVEALTSEHIERIVLSLEERGDVSASMYNEFVRTLGILNELLTDESFLQNKVIYQANKHYGLSESEVKRALRKHQQIDFIAYIAMLICIIYAVIKIKRKAIRGNSEYIDLKILGAIILALIVEAAAIWFVVRPIVSVIVNRDFEIIKFLLQGA